MAISRRNLLRLTGAALAAPALPRAVLGRGAPITLKLHHGLPPIASVHTRLLAPWSKRIEQESGGALKIVLFPSMQLGGTLRDLYDQAINGVTDIVWTAPGAMPDRFPGIETFELPFVADKHGATNAKALQDFCEGALRDEFREVRPLAFAAHDGCAIHSMRAVKSLEELKGLKLRPPTRLAGEALKALGAHPIPAPLSQTGDLLVNKVVDGCIVPWDAAPATRAAELTKFHATFGTPSFATRTFLLAMNKGRYDALPADLRAVLDRNCGRVFANLAGSMFDEQAVAIEDAVKRRGHIVSEFSAHEASRWHKASEPAIHTWFRQMKERGLNGERLLADAKSAVAKYTSA